MDIMITRPKFENTKKKLSTINDNIWFGFGITFLFISHLLRLDDWKIIQAAGPIIVGGGFLYSLKCMIERFMINYQSSYDIREVILNWENGMMVVQLIVMILNMKNVIGMYKNGKGIRMVGTFSVIISMIYLFHIARKYIRYSSSEDGIIKIVIPLLTLIILFIVGIMIKMKGGDSSKYFAYSYVVGGLVMAVNLIMLGDVTEKAGIRGENEMTSVMVAMLITLVVSIGMMNPEFYTMTKVIVEHNLINDNGFVPANQSLNGDGANNDMNTSMKRLYSNSRKNLPNSKSDSRPNPSNFGSSSSALLSEDGMDHPELLNYEQVVSHHDSNSNISGRAASYNDDNGSSSTSYNSFESLPYCSITDEIPNNPQQVDTSVIVPDQTNSLLIDDGTPLSINGIKELPGIIIPSGQNWPQIAGDGLDKDLISLQPLEDNFSIISQPQV